MSILIRLKQSAQALEDSVRYRYLVRKELRKYEVPDLKRITETVTLTEEQKKKIDDLFLENYGRKIPYTWHRHYMAFNDSFDENYFPELLYIPEMVRFMNPHPEYADVYADKNLLPVLAAAAGIRTPETIASRAAGMYRDGENRCIDRTRMIALVQDAGEVFLKPTTHTSSGKGCVKADLHGGIDRFSGKTVDCLIDPMGSDWVLQRCLTCHESLARLYPDAVNTFRVMTYRWKDRIIRTPVTLRLGVGGSYVDNVHAGGICIPVDDDGSLHSFAATGHNERFFEHPDTHVVFAGYRIAHVDRILDAAIRMHQVIPQVGIIQADYTIDGDGEPVLIELNLHDTSVQLIQRPLGKGTFGDMTPEILRWLRFMKKQKYEKRIKYAFGKLPEDERQNR